MSLREKLHQAIDQVMDEFEGRVVTPNPLRVVIDPGHGGRDPGGLTLDKLEKDLVLPYAKTLAEFFKARGHEVLLTRDGDFFLALSERARIANGWHADVFISIHANASENEEANGAWVIHDDDTPKEGGVALAKLVFDEMSKIRGIPDFDPDPEVYPDASPWVGNRELTVLSSTKMPAILVELGFMTNEEDLKQLMKATTERDIANAIVTGVEKWSN